MTTPTNDRLLTGFAIRSWLEAPSLKAFGLPDVGDALTWARGRWRSTPPRLGEVDDLLPDHMHALVRVIREDASATAASIANWYHLLEAIHWSGDLLAEKVDVLCQLGYLAWRQAFRLGEAAAAWAWEERVVALASQLPSVPDFMSLPESQRTEQIRRRFLSDPAILLSECRRVTDLINRNPLEALLQAKAAYRFLSAGPEPSWAADEHAYFQANLALAIGIAEKDLGNYATSAAWLDEAGRLAQLANSSEATRARVEFVRKALAYQLRKWEQALEGTAELKQRFAGLGSPKYVARCTYVEGIALKELGRDSEALPKFLEVASSTRPDVEHWFMGLALIDAAEIYARNGQDVPAGEALASAWDLVRDTDVVGTIAHFHGVKGEILRDRGCFHAAAQAYSLAATAYAAGGLGALEAYVRVLLAEVLLAAGEDREALLEIVKALPLIESLHLVREAVVAISLLREALAQGEANPEALKILKSELQKLNKESQA